MMTTLNPSRKTEQSAPSSAVEEWLHEIDLGIANIQRAEQFHAKLVTPSPSHTEKRFGYQTQLEAFDGQTVFLTVRLTLNTRKSLPEAVLASVRHWLAFIESIMDDLAWEKEKIRFHAKISYEMGAESSRDIVIPTTASLEANWVQQLIRAQTLSSERAEKKTVYFICQGESSQDHLKEIQLL